MAVSIEVQSSEPTIRKVVGLAFPDYRGRTVALRPLEADERLSVASYWDGGSRSYFAAVRLDTMEAVPLPSTNPLTTRTMPEVVGLPFNVALIEHSIFCGKDGGVTIYLHPQNLNALALGAGPADLTDHEWAVLEAACSLKSSYGGISQYRRHYLTVEHRAMTGEEYDAAKASLIEKRLLDSRGAATMDGRNEERKSRAAGRRRVVS